MQKELAALHAGIHLIYGPKQMLIQCRGTFEASASIGDHSFGKCYCKATAIVGPMIQWAPLFPS